MNKLILLIVILCTYVLAAKAQYPTIKGTVNDTLNKQNLSNAVVSILRPKDSVLVKFVRTDANGNFELKKVIAGNYILMVSYPNYAEFLDQINFDGISEKSLGIVPLITRAKLLEEVIVKQRISAIRVKGDTTEYRADSFHVSANADVQELLKKMPGIQVNSKGEITTQGEKVNKVLVDGEEFFSDDPAVVTKNLRADAVDKVQVFDKKSDQAVFTGIDDGQKQKTINLQLKEDKKKGFFGKAEAGSDFDQYNYGKLMANAFKGKRKIAGYITHDNTKFDALNWDENRNYAGDPNTTTTINDDGGVSMYSSGDEFNWGSGLPISTTAGLHFSNKWNLDKNNTNNTFQYNKLNVTGKTSSITQNILPDTSFTNTTEQTQANERTRNKLTSMYELQIDSSSSLKFTLKASDIKTASNLNYLGKSISSDNKLINESDRTTTNNDDNKNFNTSMLWRKKFAKKGRTISVNAELTFTDKKENGFLLAKNQFFDKNGNIIRLDNVDQRKENIQTGSSINSNFTYTEPLWKNTFLILTYRLNINRNDAERNTFNKDVNGKYSALSDTLSNHFIFNTTGNTGGFNIRYQVKKFNFAVGTGLGTVTYHMNDIRKNTDREVSYTNFTPAIVFKYTPKQQRRVEFNYNGTTENPTLSQIQPFIDNIDPLNITVGNQNLKQAFLHNFNFRASDYKVLKSRNIGLNMNYNTTDNAISNNSFVDSLGRRINQAINVNGNYAFRLSGEYGFEIIPSLNFNVEIGPRISQYVNFVNGLRNETKTTATSYSINSGYWSDKWINFWVNFEASYNKSVSSIRPDVATNYWSYTSWTNLQLKFKKQKLYVDFNGEFNFYQKTAAFANQRNAYIVNGGIRKIISKDDKWETKFYVNDIFNQNLGINRNISSNFISETTTQNVKRYFMLSLIYNFSKNGKPSNMGF
jgi:Outer membrane protein beta-barrel family/Carboxypeptidase regulatory-like domain